nr:uncharacterized protein LOC109172458 [Ipomoea trifida]
MFLVVVLRLPLTLLQFHNLPANLLSLDALEVDKVAEEIEKKLPGDSKLKKSLDSIENLAEQAVSYAKQAEGVINKVEEIEKQVEEQYLKAKSASEGQDTTGME